MSAIAGHSVLIIGGTSGIGFAVAKLSLAAGCHVAIASSNSQRVKDSVVKLQALGTGSQVSGHVCDLEHVDIDAEVERLFSTVTSNGNAPLDHVIYTAGRMPQVRPLQETSTEDIITTTRLFWVSKFVVAKVAMRYLTKGYASSLTFTGGRVAEQPVPNYTLFSAGAAGLVGMTRNLALDCAPLRVNLVAPGQTRTEMWGPNRDNIAEMAGKQALLGKIGSAEEVGEAYIYLMKDANATGICIHTNGGAFLGHH